MATAATLWGTVPALMALLGGLPAAPRTFTKHAWIPLVEKSCVVMCQTPEMTPC